MTAHGGGGSATAAAVLVVVLLHLVPAATALTILFNEPSGPVRA
jgi:hypothetical protein